jgi:hypothetical protein
MSIDLMPGFGAFTPSGDLLNGSEADGTNILSSTGTNFAGWSTFNCSVTANAVVAPDGTTTAFEWNELTDTGRHMIGQTDTPGSITYPATLSVYAKAATRRYLSIWMNANNGRVYTVADLVGGTITDSGIDSPGTGTITSTSCQAAANGYFKISIVYTAPDANTSFEYSMSNTPTFTEDVGSSPSYLGTSEKIYLWRHKLVSA